MDIVSAKKVLKAIGARELTDVYDTPSQKDILLEALKRLGISYAKVAHMTGKELYAFVKVTI